MPLIFDLETNGLLEQVSEIFSIVTYDTETGEMTSYADAPKYRPLSEGLDKLAEAPIIAGHNVLTYDIKVIQKLHPGWLPKGMVRDTLLLSRMQWPDRADLDYAYNKSHPNEIPRQLIGRHSLKAYGYRLGILKGEYGETPAAFTAWSEDLQMYCEQDVRVTTALWEELQRKKPSEGAVELEHSFQEILYLQEEYGFPFDVPAAQELYRKLCIRRVELDEQLRKAFPPKETTQVIIPKSSNKKQGRVKGVPFSKVTVQEFNPNSRLQIGERLTELYGWKPTTFTAGGQPEISEETLSTLQFPEISLLSEYLMIGKRIGQIAEGNNAWLKLVKDGRIHGSVITCGAVTARCTHKNPNVAQVPANGVPYGEECRSLFHPGPGYIEVGADASGLELRCLAHYMARYDGGAYAKILTEGDIHTENQRAAGLPTRADAKRFIYAFLYGAGNLKLGTILHPEQKENYQAAVGKKMRTKFLNSLPALQRLIKEVQQKAEEQGFLRALDRRMLPVRSKHSALNLLLQSAGAIIMKKATTIFWEDVKARGFTFGNEVAQLAHIHDELQLAVREGLEGEIGEMAVDAIRKAGIYFEFRCPLSGEYKAGRNWAETH